MATKEEPSLAALMDRHWSTIESVRRQVEDSMMLVAASRDLLDHRHDWSWAQRIEDSFERLRAAKSPGRGKQ